MTIAKNICLSIATALTVSACSSGGADRYGSYDGYSEYADAGYYDGYQAADQGAGCGPMGAAGYGNAAMTSGRYGYTGYDAGSGNMSSSNTRYGGVAMGGSSNGAAPQIRKSRYGSAEYSEYGYGQSGAAMGGAGCGGYYMMPTYQVAQAPVAMPSVTTSVPVVETTCAAGQYKMTDGTCAVMMEDTPTYTAPTPYIPPVSTYVPPVSYPETSTITTDYYQPIRK